MAINKRKILEAARKFAQKGAKEKALKEYAKLLKADPKDAKVRLEIGDHRRRWGQLDEAIAAYHKVADQYTSDGFDARAVAVYKQILNLDSKRYTAQVALSELYQRMGLNAEAASALQTAAEGYQQQGKKREALELLRKMASLDPTNTTSRLKVAELLRQEDLIEEALAEYDEVASELTRQGDPEELAKIYGQMLELAPDRAHTLAALAKLLVDRGRGDRAEPFAARAIEADPKTQGHYELLANIYRDQRREDKAGEVYARLADMLEGCGKGDEAREIRQRFASLDAVGGAGDGEDREDLFGSEELELDAPHATDTLLRADDNTPLEEDALPLEEVALELDPSSALPPKTEQAPKARPKPSGDPEQLLAEASVYLRYGKREHAIENLEAVLDGDPEHRAALEKLGEAHAEGGNHAEAVRVWLRAAELVSADGDTRALEILRDRIAVLDEDAAAGIVVLKEETSQAAISASQESVDLVIEDGEEPANAGDVEIDLDLDDADVAELAERQTDAGLELGDDLEVDDAEIEVDLSGQAPEESISSQSEDVLAELEEADFYMQQGLNDEAETIFRRVLARAPNHPQALLRLGEIASARGEDPSTSGGGPAEAVVAPDSSVDAAEASHDEEIAISTDELSQAGGVEVAAEEPGETAVGIDVDVDVEDEAEAAEPQIEVTVDDVAKEAPPAPPPRPAAARDEKPSKVRRARKQASDAAASFDLAAALADVFDDDAKDSGSTGIGTAEEGFSAVFEAFKQGVSDTLTEEDYETRYDLAIAYREMGLMDDAINEFRSCMKSPARHLASLHMLGLCALDLGRGSDAVSHFEQALALPDTPEQQQTAMRFDLGRAFEAMGDRRRARAAYERVASADPDFREVAEHLAALEGESDDTKTETPTAETFESFDDLVAEAETAAPQQAETFENFDDLIAEATQDDAAAEKGDA